MYGLLVMKNNYGEPNLGGNHTDGLRKAHRRRSAETYAKVERALAEMVEGEQEITPAAVRKRAGVSQWFVYKDDVRAMIEEAEEARKLSSKNSGTLKDLAEDMSRPPMTDEARWEMLDRVTDIQAHIHSIHSTEEVSRLLIYTFAEVKRLVERLDSRPDRLLYSLPDAMAALGGVTERTLRALIADGELVMFSIEGKEFVTSRSLVDYVERSGQQDEGE